MDHGRFTEGHFLRFIGRDLLTEFFNQFQAELAAKKLSIPSVDASDDQFFTGLSRVLMSPEGLPDRMNEVLYEVQELSTEDGHHRLKMAIADKGLQLSLSDKATPEEVALRVWLSAPALLAQKYNEQRFTRLKAFDYYEKANDCFALGVVGVKRGDLSGLVTNLDRWFAQNDRGDETTVVEKYELNGEEWYLVRHGGTYLRSSKVEKRKVEVLHYRPAKDDLIVYSPRRDELRINAKTKGEKELYRTAFGHFLHGFENYFSATKTYSLEPLRALGEEALICNDVPGLSKVVLTQLELEIPNEQKQRKTFEANDVFACSWNPGEKGLVVPKGAQMTHAAFTLYVGNSAKPIEVRIKPPNTIRVAKQGAVTCVHEWLTARGFKPQKHEPMAA